MRRMVAIVGLGVAGMGLIGGCGVMGSLCDESPCTESEPDPEPACEGVCVRYMDASWDMALVGFAPLDDSPFECPPSAPEPGLSGEEIGAGREVPYRVLACSVLPEPTCGAAEDVCMPHDPDFRPCVLQAGDQVCPPAYPSGTRVLNVAGYTFTVCCERQGEVT